MKTWFKSGSPWVWMTAGAVSISLLSVIGLLLLIASRGLSYFWPSSITQFDIEMASGESKTIIGEIYDREFVPTQQLIESGITFDQVQGEEVERLLIKTGNREYVDLDFQWLLSPSIIAQTTPSGLAVFERSKNGNFYGFVDSVVKNGEVITDNKEELLYQLIDRAVELNGKALDLQNDEIGKINYELEQLRLTQRRLELKNNLTAEKLEQLKTRKDELNTAYQVHEKQLFTYRNQAKRDSVIVKDMRGELVTLPLNYVLDVAFPNDMGFLAKVARYGKQIGKFIVDDPREANT